MKILFVAPWVPTTRRPRSMGILKALSRHHDVTVLASAWSHGEALEAEYIPANRVEIVTESKSSALLRVAMALVKGGSMQQAYANSGRMRRRLRECFDEVQPDIVFFNVIRSGLLVDVVPSSTPSLIDFDEFRSEYYKQVSHESSIFIRRLIGKLEWPRMHRAETRALRKFSAVLISSPNELRDGISNIHVVRSPHVLGIPAENAHAVRSDVRDRNRILFAGRMSYAANQEAVEWFVSSVMPAIIRSFPSVVLDIVGENPPPSIRALAGEHVRVHGSVPSMLPYYIEATVAVVPVRMATGVQMKLIESLASRTPVIVSPRVAALGGVSNNRECLVADTPDEWAEAVGRIFEDKGLVESLGERGYRWFDEKHGDLAVGRAVDDVLWKVREV